MNIIFEPSALGGQHFFIKIGLYMKLKLYIVLKNLRANFFYTNNSLNKNYQLYLEKKNTKN